MKFRGYRALPPPGEDLDALVARLATWSNGAPFFFVRWDRPAPHLRLRVERSRANALAREAPFALARATYAPDVRRFGGAEEPMHRLFCATSCGASELLASGLARGASALLGGAALLGPLLSPEDARGGVAFVAEALLARVPEDRRAHVYAAIDARSRSLRGPLLDAARALMAREDAVDAPALRAIASAAMSHPRGARLAVALRHLHLLHNRLGVEGLAEVQALLTLRHVLEERP